MFKPKYRISPKILANIKRITVLVTELNSKKFSKVVLLELERSAREISSYSSTSIEGNPLPLTEVKKILKSRPKSIRDTEKEVLNYNHALEKLNRAIKVGSVDLKLKLILEIQKLIMSGLIENRRCGKIRKEPVFVNDPRTRQPIYLPPDHQDVNKLLQELLDYIRKNKQKLDALILAGLFHKQFVIIHPFVDGNGRTARLATKVLLANMGLNTFNLFSFENFYNKNVTKYFSRVGVFGNHYEIEKNIDFTEWLEYFTDGIIDELLRVEKELKISSLSPETALEPHHNKLLKYIEEHGYITDKQYSTLTKRAKATRNLDFRKLIDLELIQKIGKGKSTYYKLCSK